MAKKAMEGADRKAALLKVGAQLASKYGAVNVTRRMVAKAGKVSDGLVTHYFGGAEEAQAKYAREARRLKLPLPDKAKSEAIGAKLRAHGPRKAPARKRSIAEVKAIKNKVAAKKIAQINKKAKAMKAVAKKAPARAVQHAGKLDVRVLKDNNGRPIKPAPSKTKALPGPSENKTAARVPKLPPLIPALPQ